MMRRWMWAALMALALTACGGTEEGGDQNEPEPCGGACPPQECVFGMCQIIDDNDGDDMIVDQPDADEDAQEPDDVEEPDAEPDADEEPDVEEDVTEEDVDDPPPGCEGDEACEDGQICDDALEPAACREGCRANEACPDGLVCAQATLTCVSGCAQDSDCPLGEECDENACVGTGCARDSQCEDFQFCDRDQGRCAPGCREDNCPAGEFCQQETRICQPGCSRDEDCAEDEFCNETVNTCENGCRNDGDCEGDDECVRVEEEGEPLRQLCAPAECGRDRDCERNEYCGEDPFIEGRQTCVEGCRLPNDNCPDGQVCDENTRQCGSIDCQQDDECGDEFLICETRLPNEGERVCRMGCRQDDECGQDQICVPEFFECTCDEDADCPSPDQVCAQGGCVEACSVDADCPEGAFCDPGLRQCAFGCLDDVLEPNNGFGQTVPLEPGVNQDLRMCYDAQEGGLPEEAQDCFDFFIDAPSQVTVAVTFSHAEGDLNAVMVNPSFVELGRAESLDDNEEIVAQTQEVGIFKLCIIPASDLIRSSYGLSLTIEAQ